MSEHDKRLAEIRLLIEAKAGDVAALRDEREALKRLRWAHKCCRCWPRAIGREGYCSCCDYDHVAGKRDVFMDPDPEASP